ncbi:MAG: ABC transporter permease [Chloroflexota bacterium]
MESTQNREQPSLIITPTSHRSSAITYLRSLADYQYLLKNLVRRDLTARYKNSLLGVLWSLLTPLFMMLVYTVLFTVLRPGNQIRLFYIFILSGLVPWLFNASTIGSGTVSVTSNASLVKKVYFPRLLLPLSAMLSSFVNFLLAFGILIVFLFISGIGITIHALWVPVILLIQMIFMLGVSMVLSALNVFYRDVRMIMDVVLLAWFFLTPVFYPLEDFNNQAQLMGVQFDAARIMRWINPMASIVDGYRTVLWGTLTSDGPASMEPLNLLRTFLTAVIVFAIGLTVFRRYEHLFGEVL